MLRLVGASRRGSMATDDGKGRLIDDGFKRDHMEEGKNFTRLVLDKERIRVPVPGTRISIPLHPA